MMEYYVAIKKMKNTMCPQKKTAWSLLQLDETGGCQVN